MSLLHQVLRDIDQRRGDAATGLPPLLRDAGPALESRVRKPWWLLLVALVPVLALLWVAQPTLLPAADTLPAAPLTPLTPAVIAEPVVAEPVVAQPVVAEPVVAEPVVAEPVVAEPVVAEPVVAEPVVAKPVVAESSPPLIIRTGAEARQWYQRALVAARQQRWPDASTAIEQALRLDSQDEYAALQLRIWLQQQRRDDFIRYYRQEQQRTALSWLTVAAPGLHLLGFVPEAIGAYEQLLLQQPQPQWSLALAAALRDNGQPQRARALLLRIPRAALTPAQQHWIEQILSEPQS